MGCTASSTASAGGESQLRMTNAGGSLDDGFSERLNLEAKIVLLGDSGVGKSSLALRFCRGRFPQYHEVTIGAAFLQQTIRVGDDGSQLKLYIWDTGGQERFRAMAPLYYRDAAGAVVVYDVTNPASMDAVRFWVEELKQRGPANCCIAVVSALLFSASVHGASSQLRGPRFFSGELCTLRVHWGCLDTCASFASPLAVREWTSPWNPRAAFCMSAF